MARNVGDQGTTRRDVLLTAGRTAAVGAAFTAGGAAVASSAGASSGGGAGPAGELAFAFVGRIDQNGGAFTGYGFVTEIGGFATDALFASPSLDLSEANARFTVAGDVTLESRSVRGQVTVLDAVGDLAIFLQDDPGADFSDPTSFRQGTAVARYSMELHDVLTVIAPNEGIPTLSGELHQTDATSFTLDGAQHRIGNRGTRLRLEGTGHGVRTDATTPVAHIDLAANVFKA